MGMVVRTNTMAINANRQLGMNSNQVSKSLEKLASGFRINRAGDDASGLAISEKMKAQIKGLEQASANSQDGISLVQTAEGALTEVHSMLNRMVELATKSASGTIRDEVDRENIQNEVNALNQEIDRIGNSTNFNGIKLLDGSLSGIGSASAAGVPSIQGLALTDTAAIAKTCTVNTTAITSDLTNGNTLTYKFATSDGKSTDITLTVNDKHELVAADGTVYAATQGTAATDCKPTQKELADALAGELGKTGLADKFAITATATGVQMISKEKGSAATELLVMNGPGADGATKANTAATVTGGSDAYQSGIISLDKEFTIGGKKFLIASSDEKAAAAGKDVNVVVGAAVNATSLGTLASIIEQKTGYKPTVNATNDGFDFKASAGTAANGTGGLTLQIGDTSDTFNKVTVAVSDMRSSALGVAGLDVSTQDAAGSQIAVINEAINKVSMTRGDLGALQNRLEHTINNLDVTAENMNAANSRIRDTDMAKEMMNYTKMNVLVQSAQAMLAQANQNPQSILQLLQ